ncbi:hypothetical protein AOQ84DRAFT_429263 [Glonium stellatum]|uniref:Uncharacterized protein n=1 Tax=Glonium stellatum TaxID=574774 RepID=A0A8E2FAP8_9PEZI|nr:hypothetical protein AOQ84DRAFT_429263 [Glonium stellatum]
MRLQYIILALITTISAVPLNINLGAYSPALVVGDGEISFDSTQKAAELMETLASGAVPPANANQNQNPGEAAEPAPAPAAPEAARATPPEANANANAPVPNLTRRDDEVDSLVAEVTQWIKRDLAGFREALNFAREAMKNQPKVELGTGKEGSGVGVVVNAGVNVPAESAANGAPAPGAAERARARARREVVGEEPAEGKGKMTLVAITEV